MTMHTSGGTPCVMCASEGGAAPEYATRPRRRRGHCDRCYAAQWKRGTFKDIPIYNVMDHDAPCLGCGEHKELMARQLCKQCYARADHQGTVKNYPQCGAVPVPYLDKAQPEYPDMPPPLTPAELGRFLWFDAEGNRAQAGVWGPHWHPSAELARDEAFATAWMAAHPSQALIWENPSLAMFAAHEAVAA